MKIRMGFVSNSSTSTFICDICGGTEAGMDLCLSDCDMSRCENGHIYHNDCNKTKISSEDDINCPFCNLDDVTDWDVIAYLLKKFNVTRKGLEEEIKQKFSSFEEFEKYLKEKNEK
jgi:hypothetical protein